MNISHQFGGSWTEDKLNRLKKYLEAYMKIFKGNVKASWFTTIYVDAFAGTGYRKTRQNYDPYLSLFGDEDVVSYQRGSAYTALEIEHSFDKYLFIEKNPEYVLELELLRKTFPRRAEKISIHSEEANSFLQHWCQSTDWRNTRAVVFLDPYGMQVEWKTIEALGCTQGVDLWILFPVGQAVNRLLTRAQPPTGAWANRLTSFFGIDDWKEAFYQKRSDLTLFGPENSIEKDADFDSIEQYFIRRLETVFAKAAKNPLPLFNSRNVPIFLLCFAAANPKGANTAVKIAQNILGK